MIIQKKKRDQLGREQGKGKVMGIKSKRDNQIRKTVFPDIIGLKQMKLQNRKKFQVENVENLVVIGGKGINQAKTRTANIGNPMNIIKMFIKVNQIKQVTINVENLSTVGIEQKVGIRD